MIELSGLKTPGWQRVVAELSAPAPDDRVFLMRLVGVLVQVSGARQGVLFGVDRGGEDQQSLAEPRPLFVFPAPQAGPQSDLAPAIEQLPEARSASRAAVESGQTRIFGLDNEEGFYDGSPGKGCIISVPVQAQAEPQGPSIAPHIAITLLIEPRSRQAIQTTAALVEVLAGYVNTHAMRQQARRARTAAASLDLAGRLIAAVNQSPSFRGAALQLANDLSRQLRADRVAVGWVRGVGEQGSVRVVAISDTEHIDRRMEMVRKIQAAMDECLDQEQAVLYPPPPESGEGADILLAQAITHAHRELGQGHAALRIASLPLRCEAEGGPRILGVVTVESTGESPLDPQTVELLQATLDLLAPVLRLRRLDDRALPTRALASGLRGGRWLVGPTHTGWKLTMVVVMAAAMAVTFVQVPYRVDAPVELQPREKRIISAPFDALVATLPPGVVPGRQVEAGDVLLELDTIELRLGAMESEGRVRQAMIEADAHLRANKQAEQQQALERARQAQAQLDLYRERIERASVRAPISGTLIAGDLTDKVGAAVRQGDPLFEIASMDEMVVVARVQDRDIALIADGRRGAPTRGEVATRADPSRAYPLEVERIVPLAQSKDGVNAFEVRARLQGPPGWLRPGMEGLAKFETGRHSLLWIGTRRIRDTLRLWLWW